MPIRRRKRMPFKACKKCKLLVPYEVERCPLCSSTTFSEDWEGMVIILSTDNSTVKEIIDVKKPGKYAIKVR